MARRGRDLAREAMGKRAEQSPPVSKALFFFRFKPMQNASERRICERAILSESVVFFCVLVPGIIYLQSLLVNCLPPKFCAILDRLPTRITDHISR